MELLEVLSHVSAILTAAVAAVAYSSFQWERRGKRIRLENYLREEKEAGADQGQRTVLHLVANLGMTETQVVDAAFRSKRILRRLAQDANGRADTMLLQYHT